MGEELKILSSFLLPACVKIIVVVKHPTVSSFEAQTTAI